MPLHNTDSERNYDHNKLRHNVYTANDKLNTKSLQRDILLRNARLAAWWNAIAKKLAYFN